MMAAAASSIEELVLYWDYSRQQIHNLFKPETPFTPQAGSWGSHGGGQQMTCPPLNRLNF